MYIIQHRDNRANVVTIIDTARTIREAQALQRSIRRALGCHAIVQIDKA